ncbi:zinc finger protein 184-like [Notolabrus celidotus]|uniref:zinc finger protein 184-like n=1 Tax=Notolabrus celidotus TaxID=1203425 RepID=UPI0014902A00|nr:zinc finger protein 184-like [Notolabrus celidotus]
MSSAESLREFIIERLTAAAEDIFVVCQRTVVLYEEEIDRQRRLLDVVWKPHIQLHRLEIPQQHVCKEEEEEGLSDQQLCNQETSTSLDQEDPEPTQVKEEHEDLCTREDREQLELGQATKALELTLTFEESDNSEPELRNEDQLLSPDPHVADNQDPKTGEHGDSESTRKSKPKKERKVHKRRSQNTKLSETHCDPQQGEKSFKCDICGEAFRYMSELHSHKKVHKEGSGLSKTLKDHRKTHTGKKSHSCRTCEKRFPRASELKRHKIIHLEEKPFTCKTCDKSFQHRYSMCIHMRTHTGERLYSCDACGKCFKFSNSFKDHMETHTSERPNRFPLVNNSLSCHT